jgi:predicted alpha/beta-hydrolase family hydrolase
MSAGEPFDDITLGPPAVRGFLHRASVPSGDAFVLTHGAGGNCRVPLLVALAGAFANAGITALRCDLPYRQERPKGPPSPARSARDREGLEHAVLAMRRLPARRVFLGGLSYGGRQASMLAAAAPDLADALLLLSYPLHPPGRVTELRTAHLPNLGTPTLFVHGSVDPFGSLDEIGAARALIPAPSDLVALEGAGHGLYAGRPSAAATPRIARRIADAFLTWRDTHLSLN